MLDGFVGVPLQLLDTVRWLTIVWLLVGISWLVQLAMVVRMRAVTMLSGGIALSLFLDIGDQYERLDYTEMSYRLPVTLLSLVLITFGMRYYVRSNPATEWVRYFPVLFRLRQPRGLNQDGAP